MPKIGLQVLRGSATSCGPFKVTGEYGDAQYSPMLHSSTLDVPSQTLYVLVAPTNGEVGIAIIDLKSGTMTKVDVEATPDEAINGINYDASSNTLFGVGQVRGFLGRFSPPLHSFGRPECVSLADQVPPP